MPLLKVDLCRKAPEGELAVRVSLYSDKRIGLISRGYVDPDDEKLVYKVAVLAGTLAERQCELYKDDHNPGQVAAAGERLINKLMKMGDLKNQEVEREFVS